MPSLKNGKFLREAIPGVQIWEDTNGGLPFIVMEPGVSAYFPLNSDNFLEARMVMDERKFLEIRGGGIDSPNLYAQGQAVNALTVHPINTAQAMAWEPIGNTMKRIKAGWDQLRDKDGSYRSRKKSGKIS